MSMRFKLKTVKRPTVKRFIELRNLKEENAYEESKLKMNVRFREVKEENTGVLHVLIIGRKFKMPWSVLEKKLKNQLEKTKAWMTAEILNPMITRKENILNIENIKLNT